LVVATVNGTPVYASQVAAHTRTTGEAAGTALDDLLRQELLAQEARRRGFDNLPETVRAREQALVHRFVTDAFGRTVASPEAIRAEDARPVYRQQQDYFRHGRMLQVWNVCTSAEQARAIYEDARTHPPRAPEDYRAIARSHGAEAQSIFTEEDSRGYHPLWRKAVFAALHRKGDLMAPVHLPSLPYPCTDHTTWAEEAIAPRNDSFEDALPEIRRRIFEDWRRNQFLTWSGRLVRKHQVELHPEALPR
jgi:hypothetical protein